ncbi:hypothetical protein KKA85_09490, partial [bacterium]|nr:hypothetical protein [bacterium]
MIVGCTFLLLLLVSPCPAHAVNIDYTDYFHWAGLVEGAGSGSYEDVTLQGDYLYAARNEGGIHVVSVADPLHPVVVGEYATPDDALDIAVSWPYAYVAAAGAGLLVLDVADPADPLLLGSSPMPDLAQGVAIDGNRAFVACGAFGLVIVDIADPEVPFVADWLDTSGDAHGVTVWGAHLVVSDGFSGIHIVARDPYAVVKTVDTPGQALGVFPAGDHLYVADYDAGLAIVHAAPIADAAIVGTVRPTPAVLDVAVAGDMAVLASHYGGIVTADVSNVTAPALIAGSTGASFAYGIALDGEHAYLAAGSFIHTYALGNGATVPVFDHLALNVPRAVAADRFYLYAIDFARLSVVDPGTGAKVGVCGTLFDPHDICVAGSYAYIADDAVGLRVADVSDSTDPDLAVGIYLGGEAWGLTLHEDRLYVAVDGLGLAVLSLEQDAGSPAWVGFGVTPGQARDVVVQGGVAYVADGTRGLHLFDVSGPGNPPTLGSLVSSHEIRYLDVEGGYAYGIDGDELVVFDVTDPADIQLVATLRLLGPLRGIEV